MSRHFLILCGILAYAIGGSVGCRPQQPFFFCEDGDLSHYIGKATEIEYPDVETASLEEVTCATAPLSLENPDPSQIWDLSLEEATRIALTNSKVIRQLPSPGFTPNLLSSPDAVPTVYDPALAEANPRFGVAAALSAFDAQFTANASWERNDLPQNINANSAIGQQLRPNLFQQDLGSFQARLAKQAATGAVWSLTHNVSYEWNNIPVFQPPFGPGSRLFASDWNVDLAAEFRQPLLQGNGVQFNRIAGPNTIPGFYNGVMIARVNTDVTLTDFESQVRNLVNDVERGYWDLYLAYRNKHALTEARERALDAANRAEAAFKAGRLKATDVTRARHQYFDFKSLVENAQSSLFTAEASLRFVLGVASADGRLIRPSDEPTAAEIRFHWGDVQCEALTRSVELRRQKWQIKRSELELIAAKNYVLPRLDAIGRYRWRGMGDQLIDSARPNRDFDNAYQEMTSGEFEEWLLGLELSIPLGFRKELAGIRHAQLSLARERAVYEDMELAVVNQLQEAMRDLEKNHVLAHSNFNKRLAAMAELGAWEAEKESGLIQSEEFNRMLEAHRIMALAEIDYYRTLVDYNKAIAQVHFRKGSLLEYSGVCLAEGPWPAKAYFDATRRARARDASFYLDYGFTRPSVISQGPYQQHGGGAGTLFGGEGVMPHEASLEAIPTPAPVRDEAIPQAPEPWEPEAASVLDPAGSEPAILPADDSPSDNTGAAVGPAGKKAKYDLGAFDLRLLAGRPAEKNGVPAASPIQTVAYEGEEPAAAEATVAAPKTGWKRSATSSSRGETVSRSSSRPADSSSLRWKSVER